MSKSLRIGVDLDGVVCDFTEDWKQCYRSEFGEPGTKTTWDGFSTITHFNHDGEFWEWLETTQCWNEPIIIDDAITALQQLAQDHKLFVLTSKPSWAIHRTMEWLNTLPVKLAGVAIGSFTKSAIDCDVYIDDGPHNLEDFLTNRPDAMTVRMIRPWNAEYDGRTDMTHVHDLFELKEVLSDDRGRVRLGAGAS